MNGPLSSRFTVDLLWGSSAVRRSRPELGPVGKGAVGGQIDTDPVAVGDVTDVLRAQLAGLGFDLLLHLQAAATWTDMCQAQASYSRRATTGSLHLPQH
jgi:hypothetical protein